MARRTSGYRNILVPVDGSAPSRRAIRHATTLARKLKARITGLHVITPFEAHAYGEVLPPMITLADFEKHAKQTAERILSQLKKAAAASGVPCQCHTAWETSAADAIVKATGHHRCDLIVMASHGRRGLERLLLGSVTRTVLARSCIPVMICH